MRQLIAFEVEGDSVLGTLDAAVGTTGVLIVSGGNEVRVGTNRGMATLAQRLADAGVPCFRFDRRGVGDSGGENHGWSSSGPDIAAAAHVFYVKQQQLIRIIGLGNCDAATALALFGRKARLDALVLTNPWLGDTDPLPPPGAVRRHYARRLIDPAAWRRLLSGGIDPRKLLRGLSRATSRPSVPRLTGQVAAAIANGSTTILLAEGDRTAQHFAAALPAVSAKTIATSSHSFADAADVLLAAILFEVKLFALRR